MIYKKGDKVRILGGVTWHSKALSYVGDAAIVDRVDETGRVRMVTVCKETYRQWSIQHNNEVEPFIKVGEQMEFSFMREE